MHWKPWFILIIVILPAVCHGQLYFRKDLSTDWIVYDKEMDKFIPLLDNPTDHAIIHFYLNLNKNKSNEVEICNEGAITLLIEGKISNSIYSPQCKKHQLDSLFNIYRKDSVLITFYKKEKSSSVTANLLYPALGYTPPIGLSIQRLSGINADFYIVSLLMITILVILFKEKYRIFYEEFVNLSTIFNFKTRQSIIYKSKVLSSEVITVLSIESLGLSFLLISILSSTGNSVQLLFNENASFGMLFSNWVLIALAFLLMQIGHFFVISLANKFFSLKSFVAIQFFEHLRLNYYALVILFFLCITAFVISGSALTMLLSSIWITIILLYCLRTLIIFQKLVATGSIRKLHLFSYFCATEMMPAMVIIKVVFF